MSSSISPDADFNQPPPLENYNLFDSDCALKEAVARNGGGWIDADARKFGELLGKPETINLGVLANRFPPELRTHDRFGYRIDEVAYHPAYHELLSIGIEAQTHSLPWKEKRLGVHVARAALVMLRHQIDEGSSCPLTMVRREYGARFASSCDNPKRKPEDSGYLLCRAPYRESRFGPRNIALERRRGIASGTRPTKGAAGLGSKNYSAV